MQIYKTTNLINGKIYVGKNSNDNPNYFGSGKYFINALKKYGKENFQKEILEDNIQSLNQLNEREIFWINELNSIGPNGYNLSTGGSGGDNFKNHPDKEIIRDKISKKVYQYDLNGNFIKEWRSIKSAADVYNKSLTAIMYVCQEINTTTAGYIWCYKKINKKEIQNRLDRIANVTKCVYQYDLNGNFIHMYDSISDAHVDNIKAQHIGHCCRDIRKTSGNFIWSYTKLSKNDIEKKLLNKNQFYPKEHKWQNKAIIQYDTNDNFIKEFESLKSAGEINNIKTSNICLVLKGIRKKAGGYFWKYK